MQPREAYLWRVHARFPASISAQTNHLDGEMQLVVAYPYAIKDGLNAPFGK